MLDRALKRTINLKKFVCKDVVFSHSIRQTRYYVLEVAQDKRAIYEHAGLTNRLGYGHRPALLVVDMQLGFTDPEKSPLAGELVKEIKAINTLLGAAHRHGLPVIFTAIGFEPARQTDGGLWVEKAPTLRRLTRDSELAEIDPRLRRQAQDVVLIKQYASAFFGTPLTSTLTSLDVDTLVVTGCTTSGCVRASVVDALSYGFRPIIPREAVGDRARGPHEANLFDIDSKYGDVVALEEALRYLEAR